jgi:hypothetical protein
MNKQPFQFPETPTCKVTYKVNTFMGTPCTEYLKFGIIPTPRSTSQLQVTMLARGCGLSQIKLIEPVQPAKPLERPHPALHRMSQYATAAEH